jgi:ElaB/YqjD/DUF883 family membrane-anchored ribosome-binding protein
VTAAPQTGLHRTGRDMTDQSTSTQGRSATAARADELAAQVEDLRRDVAAISSRLSELVATGTREGREQLETRIRRSPLTAVLIALGLGYLVGVLRR